MSTPVYREAKRQSFCRSCDCEIEKGSMVVSLYSFRNRGQNILICPVCAKYIGEIVQDELRQDN